MNLDPVVVDFEARTSDFVAAVEAAKAAAEAFRDSTLQAVAAVEALRAAIDTLPDEKTIRLRVDTSGAGAGAFDAAAIAAQADAMKAASDAAYGDAAAQEAAAGAMEHAGGAATFETLALRELRDMSADLMMQTAMMREAQDATGQSIIRVDNSVRNYNQTVADSAQAGQNAARFWGVMPLTWNAIHWAITGAAEALAVIVPAMVAAGAAGAVGLQGAVDVGQRMNAVYTATEATMSYLGKTVSTGLAAGMDTYTQSAGAAADAGQRLHDNLQKAQDAAQPRVYELLGAALNGANDKFGVFNQIGSQTITMLDQFGAKLDIELQGPLGNFASQITHNAVPDLQGLGQALGNVGHAVATAAGDMPGMAEVLLRVLDAGTQALVWALHFKGAMDALFLAHEAQMWGGLLSNVLGKVSGALAAGAVNLGGFAAKAIPFEGAAAGVEGAALGAGTALESTAAFLGGPWGTAIAAGGIALAFLIAKFGDAKDATQQWISSLEATVGQARGLQQVADTYDALQQVNARYAQSQKVVAEMSRQMGQAVTGVASRFETNYNPALDHAAQDNYALSQAHQQLSQDFSTEIGNIRLLSSEYKVNYADAAQLAADAGVSLTQTLKGNSVAAQEARQMIRNLIAGYGGMASVGSELGQDINAISFATDIQNGDVTKLNQAWDTFISTVQGPSAGFLGFAQSLTQFSKDAGQAGASISGLGGSVVTSSRHVNTASVQLQQDFNSSVTSAQGLLDSLRTVATITGHGGPLVRGIKDVVAAMIPMAGKNEAARAQLHALAQEAGGPASGSMRDLATWAGHAKNPLTDLYNLSMQAAGAIQRLGTDTQQLATTMQSSLNQTLVSQAQSLTGVNQKTATYLQDLQNLGPGSLITQNALEQLNNSVAEAGTLATTGAAGINALSGKISQQGQAAQEQAGPRAQYNADLQRILDRAPGAAQDLANLSTQIATGRWASQVAARAQVIRDLEAMHLSARQATSWVDNLIAAIGGLHSKTVTITTVMQAVAGSAAAGTSPGSVHGIAGPSVGHAAGWKVPGYGGGDVVPAWLEPGEAVVPKHLVPAVAPFLGAHHVPGFAPGGIIKGGGGSMGPAFTMSDVTRIWAAELWRMDREKFGKHSPIALAEMQAILRGEIPGRGFLPRTALGRLLGFDEHRDTASYAGQDIAYWKTLGERHKLSENEKRAIQRLQHEIAKARLNDSLKEAVRLKAEHTRLEDEWWRLTDRIRAYEKAGDTKAADALIVARATVNTEENKLQSRIRTIDRNYALVHGDAIRHLREQDARKFRAYTEQADMLLVEMGYRPVLPGPLLPSASYDRGGYLPVGLSMAYNGTGKPEPVGAAGGGDVHVHLHGDLARDELWDRLQVSTLDYNFRNSGGPTGAWQP